MDEFFDELMNKNMHIKSEIKKEDLSSSNSDESEFEIEPTLDPDSSEVETNDVDIETNDLYPITIEPEVKTEIKDEDSSEIEISLQPFIYGNWETFEEFGIKSEIKKEDLSSSNSDESEFEIEPTLDPDSSEVETNDVDIETNDLYPITIEPEVKTEIKDEDSSEIEISLQPFIYGNWETFEEFGIKTEIKAEDLTSSNSDMRTEVNEEDLSSSNSDVSHAAVHLENIRDLRKSTLNARRLRRTYPYDTCSGCSACELSNVKLLKERPTSRPVSASTSTSVSKIMKPRIRSTKPKASTSKSVGKIRKPRICSTKPKTKPLTAFPKEMPATFSEQVQASISVKTQLMAPTPVSENEKQSTLVAKQLKPISSDIVQLKKSTSTIRDDSSTCITGDVNPSACNGGRLTLSTVDTNSIIKQVKPTSSNTKQVTLVSNSILRQLLTSGPKKLQPSADFELVPSTSSANQMRPSFDSKRVKLSTSNLKQVQPSDNSELAKASTPVSKQVTLASDSRLVKLLTSGPKQVQQSADSEIVQPSTSSAKPSTSGAKLVKVLPKPDLKKSIVYIAKGLIQTSDVGSFNALKVNPSLVAKQVKMSIFDGEIEVPLVYFTQPVKSSGRAQVGTSHSQPLKPSSSVPTQGKLYSSVATQVEPLTPVARAMKPNPDGQMKVPTYDIGQGPSTSNINAVKQNSKNDWPSASNQKVSTLVVAAKSHDNLCRMDPAWHPWL